MLINRLEPVNEPEIADLYDLIQNADISNELCSQLLERLGFSKDREEEYNKSILLKALKRGIKKAVGKVMRLINSIISYLLAIFSYDSITPPRQVFLLPAMAAILGYLFWSIYESQWSSSSSPISAGANLGAFVLAMIAFRIGYRRWELAGKNRNVDDAIERKALANQMIIDNAAILRPYVGNVFGMENRYANTLLDDNERIKVQMYIFTEIDNLELVFDKSRMDLIQTEYVLRAIKIFEARAENPCFESEARELIYNGRYNRSFVRCAETLLNVGLWAGTRRASSVKTTLMLRR